jgi:tRNA A37 threonylcarbamoyltransferase TsaD
MPEFTYSLDNAAMIGAAAAMRFNALDLKKQEELQEKSAVLEPSAILSLS